MTNGTTQADTFPALFTHYTVGMQVGTQWCFLGQLINYDSMSL
jgi:hypothetical protein